MLKYLLEKEFKQLFRNSFLPKLIFIFPVVMMILLPWAANFEVKQVNLVVVDNDHSTVSDRLIRKIEASGYFLLNRLASTYDEAMKAIEAGDADMIMEIPIHFERKLARGENVGILLAANAVNGTKGGLGSSYLASIINDYLSSSSVSVHSLNLYNPNLDYKYFIVPALVVMLLTLLCGFLPALNIVSEKEKGTIEQMNVTPVSKFTFILAKLLPYWIIGLIVFTICFILAWAFYGIFPVGRFIVIYINAAVFILAVSGLGLVISNHSATMQQAMFVMFFCLIILMLMSGFFTPIASMPGWAQFITVFNPLKYMMQVMRMVYLRGSGFAELLPQLITLSVFAFLLNSWAVVSYRKNR